MTVPPAEPVLLTILRLSFAGLIGALIASVTTFAWTLYLDRERCRREKEREDRIALGWASLLLLQFSQGNRLLADIQRENRARENWRLLIEIARAIIPVRSAEYLPLAAETAYFVIDRSPDASPEDAIALSRMLSEKANPDLVRLYDEIKAKWSRGGKA